MIENNKVLSFGLPIKMFENFSRKVQNRIPDNKYQLMIPSSKTIHTKLYLLENSVTGDNRLIIGSANLLNRAFSGTTKADLFIEFYVDQFHEWIDLPVIDKEQKESETNSEESQNTRKGFFKKLFGK